MPYQHQSMQTYNKRSSIREFLPNLLPENKYWSHLHRCVQVSGNSSNRKIKSLFVNQNQLYCCFNSINFLHLKAFWWKKNTLTSCTSKIWIHLYVLCALKTFSARHYLLFLSRYTFNNNTQFLNLTFCVKYVNSEYVVCTKIKCIV